MIDARTAFENRLHEIECLAGSHFRHLDPDAREEAIQNSVVLAYRYWLRLAERGKTGDDCFSSAVWWAAIHTKQGRKGGGSGKVKAKCVIDYARRGRGDVAIQGGLDLNYTLCGHERDVLELLEIERHQRLQLFRMCRRKAIHVLLDRRLKRRERGMVAAVERASFEEFPQAFDQVQVGRVRGQVQERDPQLDCQRLHHGVPLIAGVV